MTKQTKSPSTGSTADKDSETSKKPVFSIFDSSMSKAQIRQNLLRTLKSNGFEVPDEPASPAHSAPPAARSAAPKRAGSLTKEQARLLTLVAQVRQRFQKQ